MKLGWFRLSIAVALIGFAGPAAAARVGVLSNKYFAEAATSFTANLTGHTFTAVDVSVSTPTLAALNASYDVVLLFEDGVFANSTNIGTVIAQYANAGHPVIVATFYDQDRSDAANPAVQPAHGWGVLETLDPNTTDGIGVPTDAAGVPNATRTLNPASIVAHPLTQGLTTLFSQAYAGGNQAKPGTAVLANWSQPNARGLPDPVVSLRMTGRACVIGVGIVPHYAALGTSGTNFGGDYYRLWQNAFNFAGANCGVIPIVPTLGEGGLVLLALLLAALAWRERRRLAPLR